MTASFESVADRRIFVNEFGEDILFNGEIIGIRTVRGIFDNEYEGVLGESIEFAMQQPRLTCVEDDVVDVRYGDTVTIRGSDYVVRTIMPNGTGITELMLESQGA